MRLTRRGCAVLGASTVLCGIGQLAGYPLFLALGAAGVGAVAAALAVTGSRPRVSVVREVYPDRVERGRPASLTLRVRNPGTRRQAAFTAVDRVGTGQLVVAVRSLAPGAEVPYLNELPTGRRGRHQIGPLTLSRTDALGLGESRLSIGDTAVLWVYPRTHPVRALAGGRPRHHHEGVTTVASPRGSLDLREVREYVPGDEVRHLHWKATARTGTLMIRDYVDPNQPRFTALLDNRPDGRGPERFEDAVEIAASLLVAAAKADHRCRLVTASGVDVATAPGAVSARLLLDELCVLDRADDQGLPLVPAALSLAGGGQLVVVTSAVSAADSAALAATRTRFTDLVVVVLGADAAALAVPGARVLPARDAADAARRWHEVVTA
ncbi:DUF58 domain-containing protein [Goodfellowiella coeruleoviolacea]|uniref:Uncharacterized conserved protein, DUF58 family, contains vWF domain n=1 Tax=Goodfellowiella coeruleoviolacea TaxID=334858 RepID=A0AAE3KJM4_9PSEU|nr:DUF58 domain-containing protein [Goodfellowiella coeruleoviolacea]MCP2164468.1 Uncharacterized conserved protein, DUF58 family, contains vWF domain [Goodfellowiella coeruleoviolacea]